MQAVVRDQADLMRSGVGLFGVESPLQTKAGMEMLSGPRDLDRKRCAEAVLLFGRWVCLVSSERRASSYHYVRR